MSAAPRRALISCSDKQGLTEFAKELVALQFELLSTGGTAAHLRAAGLPVTDVSAYTGFPEMLDGRVKTLHPRIHGGLLGRPTLPNDQQAMTAHDIPPIELVCVNLYPFAQTVAKPDVTWDECIEQIDIGGPSMIRSAAKNHAHVLVVTQSAQYPVVAAALRDGTVNEQLRRQLAGAAFEMTATYDRGIADYFSRPAAASLPDLPPTFNLTLKSAGMLRYGENPHQRAAWYHEVSPAPSTLAAASILHGKELSYNNILDLDAALQIVREFDQPAAVVIKHNNPCGCAVADSLATAYINADAGDPVSAFGSILGFNRMVDLATVEELCVPGRFIEAIIAPGYEAEAFAELTTRPKWKQNVRLLELPGLTAPANLTWDFRRTTGGLLVQDRDDQPDVPKDWRTVTQRTPTAAELADLKFAWKVCKYVKSNAILLARGGAVVGVGAGQMSRLDSAFMAVHKAGERAGGGVAASDAFFPFRDGIDQLHAAGITAAIQPGGSKRDDEVIAACNELDIAMIFTGRRHFRH